MKFLARLSPDHNSKLISIYEVKAKIDREQGSWRGREYYDIFHLEPMIAKIPEQKAWHFAFKSGYGSKHTRNHEGSGGAGVVHEMAQYVLFKTKKINFKIYKEEYKILLKNISIEHKIEHHGKKYFIDLLAEIDPTENENTKNVKELIRIFNGKIGIEIFVSHEVGKEKKAALRAQEFGTIEYRLNHLANCGSQTDIQKIREKLMNGFSNSEYRSDCLHNPHYNEYYSMIPTKNSIVNAQFESIQISNTTATQTQSPKIEPKPQSVIQSETKESYSNVKDDIQIFKVVKTNNKVAMLCKKLLQRILSIFWM